MVNSVVHRLLLNYIMRPRIPLNSASYSIFSETNQPGVLQRVGSAAGMFLSLRHIFYNVICFYLTSICLSWPLPCFHMILNACISLTLCLISYISLAATFVLLPFNYLVSSSGEGSRNQLADCSLLVLLVLIHYRKCVEGDESVTDRSDGSAASDSLSKSNTHFSDNPYCKALENARDIECEISFLVRLF